MKKVTQEFYRGRQDWDEKTMQGDCWRACVASVLNLPIHDVPHFARIWERDGLRISLTTYTKFLAQHGFSYFGVISIKDFTVKENIKIVNDARCINESEYYFAVGTTNRGPELHSVVCYDGEMIHDPHPSGDGLIEVTQFDILVPINN